MSRAPLVLAKPEQRVSAREPDGLGHDPRVALPEPADGGDVPARVDGRDGRERGRALRSQPRGAGRVRAALAPPLGGGRRQAGTSTTSSCRSATLARDEHPRPDTSLEKLATLKPAFREGRHGHGRQLERHQRRRGGARDRERGARAGARRRAARRVRQERGCGSRPSRDGDRAGARGTQAPRAGRDRGLRTSTSSS